MPARVVWETTLGLWPWPETHRRVALVSRPVGLHPISPRAALPVSSQVRAGLSVPADSSRPCTRSSVWPTSHKPPLGEKRERSPRATTAPRAVAAPLARRRARPQPSARMPCPRSTQGRVGFSTAPTARVSRPRARDRPVFRAGANDRIGKIQPTGRGPRPRKNSP